jgi:hypothetical protein
MSIPTADSDSPGTISTLRADVPTRRASSCSGSRDRPVLGHLCTIRPETRGNARAGAQAGSGRHRWRARYPHLLGCASSPPCVHGAASPPARAAARRRSAGVSWRRGVNVLSRSSSVVGKEVEDLWSGGGERGSVRGHSGGAAAERRRSPLSLAAAVKTSLPPCETHPSNANNSIKNQPFQTSSILS